MNAITPQQSTPLDVLLQRISRFPLWIRQVIYLQLREDLGSSLSQSTLLTLNKTRLLQLWTPLLTNVGEQMLSRQSREIPPDMLTLLDGAASGRNVVNLCIVHHWTLAYCCELIKATLDKKLIQPPDSDILEGSLLFLASAIRIGEYLVKIGRLKEEHLEIALKSQEESERTMGTRTGIVEIMINMGFIYCEDAESLLFLKEESKKEFRL